MKNQLFCLGIILLAAIGCNSDDQTYKLISTAELDRAIAQQYEPMLGFSKAIAEHDSIYTVNSSYSHKIEPIVGEKRFKKIVSYIWKNGKTIGTGSGNIAYGKTLSFTDSNGNLHELSVIRRDSTGAASLTGPITFISADGYLYGIKRSENSFKYFINTEKVTAQQLEADGSWKNSGNVIHGYTEFSRKVNK